MTAGYNVKVDAWNIRNIEDDDHGGAVVTGTYLGSLNVRMQEEEGEQVLMQQGYETVRQFTFVSQYPGTFTVKERDELEISWPGDHPYYGDRFRIMRVRYPGVSPRDRRRYMIFHVTRSIDAHGNQ